MWSRRHFICYSRIITWHVAVGTCYSRIITWDVTEGLSKICWILLNVSRISWLEIKFYLVFLTLLIIFEHFNCFIHNILRAHVCRNVYTNSVFLVFSSTLKALISCLEIWNKLKKLTSISNLQSLECCLIPLVSLPEPLHLVLHAHIKNNKHQVRSHPCPAHSTTIIQSCWTILTYLMNSLTTLCWTTMATAQSPPSRDFSLWISSHSRSRYSLNSSSSFSFQEVPNSFINFPMASFLFSKPLLLAEAKNNN